MTWVRIDEGFPEHPKVIAAGPLASWLHVCAIAYCNRQLTDGFISTAVLPRLSDGKRTKAHAAALVAAGLWEVAEGGWLIHDFLTYQPSKAKVEAERASARERMANNRRSSPDVRANNDRSSEDVRDMFALPGPSRSVPSPSHSLSSSNGSSNVRPIRDDDDQGRFTQTIDIMLEIKARKHPPRDRDAWEPTTRADLVATKGDQVRTGIAAGHTPIQVAGNILGSQVEAELAAQRLA